MGANFRLLILVSRSGSSSRENRDRLRDQDPPPRRLVKIWMDHVILQTIGFVAEAVSASFLPTLGSCHFRHCSFS